LRKAVLPILVFTGIFGIGLYTLLVLIPPDDHKAKAIAGACAGLCAAVGYCWAAFRTGLFNRFGR
jgi:hypothetical protein